MTLANFVPLLVAIAVVLPVVLARIRPEVDRTVTRLSVGLFGNYVEEFRTEHPNRQAALRAAHMPTTYREYGSRTLLYAVLMAFAGSILGLYLVWGALIVLAIDPETMAQQLPSTLEFLANLGGIPSLSLLELVVLMSLSALTVGVTAGGGVYWLRWWYPSYVADNRARRIDAALPGTVAFIYALSRSGMEFPKIIRIVAENNETYGAAAAEFNVAVRNMDTFGMDVITAIQTMGRRTPSPQFREFCENFVSVLQSGHNLSEFLDRQYHDYQEEAESQQESMLGILGTLAEAYVTVLVAGPLFLITILVVIGFSVGDTLEPLQVLIYVILPFGNLAFIIYLSMVTDSLNPGRSMKRDPDTLAPYAETQRGPVETDGGLVTENPTVERVLLYRRYRSIRSRIGTPIETLIDRPELTVVLSGSIALVTVLWVLVGAVGDGNLTLAAIDDVVALSVFFVLATFAVFYEIHCLRIRAIESAIPDLLDRLASVNEAGMSVIAAIGQIRNSDLGALESELDRVWADVQWGSDLETALYRFESRVRTRTTSRVVTLLTEAIKASGNLSTVLRIAARQAASEARLRRERKQSMLEYMVVVYVSFLVFLFIIAVLSAYLLPNLPSESVEASSTMADASQPGGMSGVGEVDAQAYTTIFYHATLVQGVLSGFIAGQLSTGDVKAGAKHAATMIGVTYLLFAVVI